MTSLRRAILGVGNVLIGDEGVGVHAVRALLAMGAPPGVLVMDGGTEGLGLMDVIAGLDRLVVIDCVRGGGEPGTIYCFDWGHAGPSTIRSATSVHQVSIADVLRHVALVTELPSTTVVGIEPGSVEMGLTLSAEVEGQIPRVCEVSLRQVAVGGAEARKGRLVLESNDNRAGCLIRGQEAQRLPDALQGKDGGG